MIYSLQDKFKTVLYSRLWFLFFIILLMFFTSLRIIRINADANQDLSISAALYTDEGFKAYSPRNFILHGKWNWSPEDKYQSWHDGSPVITYIYLEFFRLFGISYKSIRYLNIIASFLTMIFLFFFVKRNYDIYTAFIALTLFGISNFIIMYNRQGFFENFVNLFLMIVVYCSVEVFKKRRAMILRIGKDRSWPFKDFLKLFFYVFFAFAASIAGIYTKQSILIVPNALISFFFLYYFYSRHRLSRFVIHLFYAIVAAIMFAYIIIAHFGWFENILKQIFAHKILNIDVKFLMPLNAKVANFDPIYLTFFKSLYIEFVYLQPLLFFSAIYFALHSYYKFLYEDILEGLDVVLSTWFLFSFLFLAIMKYHPSRYYLIIVIPVVILSARFIAQGVKENISTLLYPVKRISFRRVMISLFWIYLIFYLGLSFLLNLIPFEIRKKTYSFIYQCTLDGEMYKVIPIAAALVVYVGLVFFALFRFIPFVRNQFTNRKFFEVILVLIILFQSYQYIHWVIFSKNNLYDASVKIGKIFPEDSILVGSWGAGLAIENKLNPLVIQGNMSYNSDKFDNLLKTGRFPVYELVNGKVIVVYKKNLPVYFFVGKNQPSDLKMIKAYREYLTPDRKMAEFNFGLYDVEMYKVR
ncbi:MAG: glycosyltransferase family 39 protein [Spirochaetes bacterium]|nr:glycosyltransferase family 39 protein [Spirochaetota bacterium]